MKICKYCRKELKFENPKQYGAHLTNCEQNPSKKERDIKKIRKKNFVLRCTCGNDFRIFCTDEAFDKGEFKKFCSRSCANARIHTNESKSKISKSLTKIKSMSTIQCQNCGKEFEFATIKKRKFCSKSCSTRFNNSNGMCVEGGKASAGSQKKRSKNETYFAKLCEYNFKNVLTNETKFNGWDADIIIEDIKCAILWNGIWHYRKITKNHSLDQVQNRDRIKIKEIKKEGYIPYVIEDLGKFNEEKVKWEMDKFMKWCFENGLLHTKSQE
jgi:hypothetical protein